MPDKYYDTLMSTVMEQVKGTRATKVKSGVSTIDIIDCDIPTINPNYNIEDFDSYIDSMIQAYNRYLGYESGVTKSNVKSVFTEGLRLYCFMTLIKRYYDAQTVTLASGEKINGIFDTYTLPSIVLDEASALNYIGHRLAGDLKGVSNKTWVTEYINKVEQVLLPPQIMVFYNYYLTSMFDISNNDNKEAVTLLRFWISDETSNFITKPSSLARSSNMLPVLNKSIFESAFSALEDVLTPTMRNFVTTFLGWRKPNQDWTRDITGNTLNILRDEKVISTFNNIYPEKVTIVTHKGLAKDDKTVPLRSGNLWVRYYYDFEQLLDCEESDEVVASKYYFGIDGLNIEQMFLEANDQINTIVLNYYHYLLLTVLCSEEISGSKEEYVGGMLSTVTTIDATTGLYFPNTGDNATSMKQFCYGNDIQLMYSGVAIASDPTIEFGTLPYNSDRVLDGIIGDYGEAGDFKDQVAIFNFPIRVPEVWAVIPVMYYDLDPEDNVIYTSNYSGLGWNFYVVVNASFGITGIAPDEVPEADYQISHRDDHEAFNCYVLNPEEVHLALHTTIYLLMTGYRTYNEAITTIDNMFRGKQQSTN